MSQDLQKIIPRLDDKAFTPIAEEVVAGESVATYGYFRFEAGENVDTATATWDFLDQTGVVYSSGICSEIQINDDGFGVSVSVTGLIVAPSDLPPTSNGQRYQIRWTLSFSTSENRKPMFFLHSIKVLSAVSSPIGPAHLVEIEGDDFTLSLVTDDYVENITTISGAVYTSSNAKLFDLSVSTPPQQISSGWLFTAPVTVLTSTPTGNPFFASLDPYVVLWKSTTPSSPTSALRYAGEIYVTNPSILTAVESARRMVSKAKTTLFQQEDLLFDSVTLMAWLRRGRDLFNAASGLMTEFTMTDATGPVREFWLRYSEVSMLMAQSLAEGEKAFNYTGAAISLEVDKASVYQQMADSLKSQLDNDVKPLKQNLLKKGVTGGTGNLNGVASGAGQSSFLGISRHPASQQGRPGFGWRN